MLNHTSRIAVAGIWVSAVVVSAVGSWFVGVAPSPSNGLLWLVACLVPPAVMLMIWPAAPPMTVAELLHSVEGSKDGR